MGDYGGVPNWTGRMWNNLRLGPEIYKVFDNNYPETVRKAGPAQRGSRSYMRDVGIRAWALSAVV